MQVPPKSASKSYNHVLIFQGIFFLCLLPNEYAMCYNRHATGMYSGQRLLCAFNGVLVCGIEKEFQGKNRYPHCLSPIVRWLIC